MSGGHWGYLSRVFDERADDNLTTASLRFLGHVEHELDWGHSGDTCLACARRRVLAALDTFYDSLERGPISGIEANAVAVLRDRDQVRNYCDRCLEEMPGWYRPAWARPTIEERNIEVTRRSFGTEERKRPYV